MSIWLWKLSLNQALIWLWLAPDFLAQSLNSLIRFFLGCRRPYLIFFEQIKEIRVQLLRHHWYQWPYFLIQCTLILWHTHIYIHYPRVVSNHCKRNMNNEWWWLLTGAKFKCFVIFSLDFVFTTLLRNFPLKQFCVCLLFFVAATWRLNEVVKWPNWWMIGDGVEN